MATRTFLNEQEIKIAKHKFGSSQLRPDEFSSWLSELLLKKLAQIPGWRECKPIALGSLARQELSLRSDIDLLLVGSEEAAASWMAQAQRLGMKVRARVPERLNDWTSGVELADLMALLDAKAFFAESAPALEQQKQNILSWPLKVKRQKAREILRERYDRYRRQVGSSLLEPNLKYCAGGLRDLQQGALIAEFFCLNEELESEKNQLALATSKLLKIRQLLQLLGGGEVASAQDQLQLAELLGLKLKSFSQELQKSLSANHQLSQMIIDWALMSKRQRAYFRHASLQSAAEISELLNTKPVSVAEKRVAEALVKTPFQMNEKKQGAQILKCLDLSQSKKDLKKWFKSGWLAFLEPELDRVTGLVQFDHYHVYPLDEHIYQALTGLADFFRHPKSLGSLKFLIEEFAEQDWQTLALVALYHDLAKGRGGDHSQKGAEFVQTRLTTFGFSKNQVQDISWLVRQHLILSTAAFRRDPLKASTWRWLFDLGVAGKRLRLLALWTIIDIKATNPQAWTSWKAHLLHDLVRALESPSQGHYFQKLSNEIKPNEKSLSDVVERLDLSFLNSLSPKVLVSDLRQLLAGQIIQPIVIKRQSPNKYWLRFYRSRDEPGVFRDFVRLINSTGASILQASIQTISGFGVYDWFLIKTKRGPQQLRQILTKVHLSERFSNESIQFDKIDLIGETEQEWMISFRGPDQKGFLLAAAQTLFDRGLSIQWAKVNTWGRQVDDVFGVMKSEHVSKQAFEDLLR